MNDADAAEAALMMRNDETDCSSTQ